jgi:hypothetical protein
MKHLDRLFDAVRTPYVYIQVNEHVTPHLTFNIDKFEHLCGFLAHATQATTVTNKKITTQIQFVFVAFE